MSNNKVSGTKFEDELAQYLFEWGWWVLKITSNKAGQPADIIAVRNGRAHLIDCKVLQGKSFPLSRIETNQQEAMNYWRECNNGDCYFAVKTDKGIFMYPYSVIQVYQALGRKSIPKDALERTQRIDEWVTRFI